MAQYFNTVRELIERGRVGDSADNSIKLFAGNNTMTLGMPVVVANNLTGIFLAAADFDGDGKDDLLSSETLDVPLLLGRATGPFLPAGAPMVGGSPRGIAIADINGDKELDFVVAYQRGGVVVPGAGGGKFAMPTFLEEVGGQTYYVAVGDVNGDGRPDVALPGDASNDVSVVLASGNGGFLPARRVPMADTPTGVALADLDGDGLLDLAVTHWEKSQFAKVSVALGDGAGGFGTPRTWQAGVVPGPLVAVDINGDRRPDLLAVDPGANVLFIYLNTSK